MRISDWSSDVCSSDLRRKLGLDVRDALGLVRSVASGNCSPILAIIADLVERVGECRFWVRATSDVAAELPGRASVNRDHPAAVIVPSYIDGREFVFEGNCLRIDHAFGSREAASTAWKIGRAHVCTPVTNAHLVCRLLLENTQ